MKIHYNNPNFKKLNEEGYKVVDMHLHSNNSIDCKTKIKEIVDLAKRKNIGIAVTDHNTIKGCLEVSKYNVFLIPAIEVSCKEGCHMLVYFYNINELKKFFNKHIKNNMYNKMRTRLTHKNLIKISKKYECIISAAHPFGGGRSGVYKIKDHADLKIVEGLNGGIFNYMNNKISKLKNKKYTGGSDAHVSENIGRVVTCAKANTVKEFLDAIKKDENFIIGNGLNFFDKILNMLKKEGSLIRNINIKDYINNRLVSLGLKNEA